MNADAPLLYSEEEVRSFLPSGWHLAEEEPGALDPERAWDAKKRVWRITVLDNVDFDWPVEVRPSDIARLGAGGADARIEALRRAMDKVFRERLG
jgi:hypothetical protein